MTFDELLAGNVRARRSGRAAPRRGERTLSAAVLTCADERVVPDDLFDQVPGRFYTVRVAGNVASPEVTGSLEVAVARHRCPLLLVLGHTGCSAVRAALSRERIDGALYDITRRIRRAVEGLPPDVSPTRAIEANVAHTIRELRERSRLLREREAAGELRFAGAVYELETGQVRAV